MDYKRNYDTELNNDDTSGVDMDRDQNSKSNYSSNDRRISNDSPRSNNEKNPNNQKSTKKISTKRKKSNWKKGLMVLILAGLLISVFFTPLYTDVQNLWGGPVYPEKANFSIHRTFDINANRHSDYNMSLIVPEDISGNDLQYIRDIEWGGDPETFEKYERDWKLWEGNLSRGDSISIQIIYEVETRTLNWGYSSDNIGTIDDLPDEVKEQYDKNQWPLDEDRNDDGQNDWMIQPDHPQIKNLAEQIVEGEENLYTKSRAIYNWINNNIEYEIGREGLPKHAYWVLDSGTGDCDEQSFLYASMARAVGIPAYMELGVLYDRMVNQWGGHGWIRQIVVNDNGEVGWINIDPVNNQFFARGATRITFWVDDGIEDHLSDYYYFFSHSGQVTVSEEFENTGMETEGQVVLEDSDDIPGFTFILAIPALIISVFVHKIKKDS
ncbi:MAG: transglutaminase-like domain-containing protein [Candidatus Saliniplasma sp.]